MRPRFLRTASLLIAVAAMALLVACTGRPSDAPSGGPLTLVPRSTHAVAQIDFVRLRHSALWAALVDARHREPRLAGYFDQLRDEAGWDPLTQLDSLTLAVPLGGRRSGPVGAIAFGTFDADRFLNWLHRSADRAGSLVPALVPTSYDGVRMYHDAFRGQFVECAFFGHAAMALGERGWGRATIDTARGTSPSILTDRTFADLVSAHPSPAVLWFVAAFDPREREALARMLGAGVVDATLAVDLQADLDVRIHVTAATERDASIVASWMEAQVARVRSDPAVIALGVSELLARVALRPAGRVLDASLHVDAVDLQRVVDRLDAATRRTGPVRPNDPF